MDKEFRMKLEEAIQKAKEKWAAKPQLKQERDEVIAKYREVFKLENIDNFTKEIWLEFWNYTNNKHWRGMSQLAGVVAGDMNKLISSLKIILDESQALTDRIKRLRDVTSDDYFKYFTKSIYTPKIGRASCRERV